MNDANDAIRLKSLIFWLDTVGKADSLSFIRRYWVSRDYETFNKLHPVCPRCNGSPIFDITNDGKPYVVNGITIDRVQCYCLTLKLLSQDSKMWYESHFGRHTLDEITPIDIPSGAAARTNSIKKKVEKFLLNPTRSALINGGTGSAKSHILQSVKTNLGGFVAYITLGNYFAKLQQYREANDGSLHRFITALTYAPILCMDDFGIGHQTDWSNNTLSEIIDNRYSRKRLAPTLMTTNMSFTEMSPVPDTVIDNFQRIVSRMMDSENSTVMTMLQADYRNKAIRKEVPA